MSVVTLPKYLFTTEEFYQMGRAGILPEDARVELIEGEVVPMSPIGERHADCVDRLAALFFERSRERARIRVQNPLNVGPRDAFQPDVALVRPGEYRASHPTGADAFLVIEVADTTLDRDRLKLPRYASSGVLEVWIVDLERNVVEVHRDPVANGYRTVWTATLGQAITLAALPLTVQVSEFLG